MPPKTKKKGDGKSRASMASRASEVSGDERAQIKPKKHKPLTKKEKMKLMRIEREMKDALVQLKKEAEVMLAEFKAMEDALERKAKGEQSEQNKRVELLSGIYEIFRTAKARLLHENNKLREAEIWERYVTTDRMPNPDNVPDMRNHIYLWQQDKSSEFIDFALEKCNSYVSTLTKLDELIEYPIYSSHAAVNNWKEVRQEWRDLFLGKIDKACFNMIKNLAKNFTLVNRDPFTFFTFDAEEEHVKLGLSAQVECKNLPFFTPKIQNLLHPPKIHFPGLDVEVVMPTAYRTSPYILRVVYLDKDFFSDSSESYYCPQGLPMETDLLNEVHRCFEAKKEAKSMVADREREKVRQAKQKVMEAQEAASQAEKVFQTFHQENIEPMKRKDSRTSVASTDLPANRSVVELKKKHVKTDSSMNVQSLGSRDGSSLVLKRPKGILDERGDTMSIAKSLMHSAEAQRNLDTISMRSGLRRRRDRRRKTTVIDSVQIENPTGVFQTPSMTSLPGKAPNVSIRKDSALHFEEADDETKVIGSDDFDEHPSYDSLNLMFGNEFNGNDDVDDYTDSRILSVKELVRKTVIVDRDPGKVHHSRSKSAASFAFGGKGRKRGKSTVGYLKGKGLIEESEEVQTASDIFDSTEETRQEQYMTSLFIASLPLQRYHINLRQFAVAKGTYLLDIIFHESQPHELRNGNSVQIFHGEMNIKRDKYRYDYKAPPAPKVDDDTDEPAVDPGLQHLLHLKVPLPKDVVFFEMPFVALWDSEQKFWTKEHVYKLEVDLESNSTTFRLGRVMPFAFFVKKYSLMPFLTWNMKPNVDSGGVSLTLSTSRANFGFHVLGFEVCLTTAEGLNGTTFGQMEDTLGKYMHLHKLISIMKSRGLYIFPDEDGFLYTQTSSKDVVLEDHANMTMAMFSEALEFNHTELNTNFKRRKLAFKARECMGFDLELRYQTVVSTCLSAQLYRIGQDDESFDDTKLDSSVGFCPDTYYLLNKAFTHVISPSTINPLQVLAVYSLLSRIKVLSYSGQLQKDTTTSLSDSSKKSIRKRGKKAKVKAAKNAKSRSSIFSVMLSNSSS